MKFLFRLSQSKNWILFFTLVFLTISTIQIVLRVILPDKLLKANISTLYYSQEENLLFHQASDTGNYREWNEFSDFPEHLVQAVLVS